MSIFYSKLLVVFIATILFFVNIYFFSPILNAKNLIFPYALKKFDIIVEYPIFWQYFKYCYYIITYFSILLIINSIIPIKTCAKNKKNKNTKSITTIKNISNCLHLFVGYNATTNNKIYIPEKGLYQNILVTGTIGTRENQFSNVSFP